MTWSERKQTRKMKWILFTIFVIIFIVIVAGTIAKVFFDYGKPNDNERAVLFKVFIVEVGLAVLTLFKVLFWKRKRAKEKKDEVPKINGKYKYEIMYNDNKTIYYGRCRIKQHGRVLKLHGSRSKVKIGKKKENISIHWYSKWAEICLDNKLRMDYSITSNGVIKGYVIIDVEDKHPKNMMGEVHLLHEPYVYGIVKLMRI